jgi:alpha-beta hydrolase superfamily lysophospholipase
MSVGWQAAVAFASGVLSALGWVIVDWGAWMLVVPGRGRRRVVVAPSQAPTERTQTEAIALTALDGAELTGDWYAHPESHGRTLLLLHGFAEDRSALLGRAAAMIEVGWNVAVLDSRARGHSGGDRCTFGAKEVGDLQAWLDWLRERVGPSAVFVVWGRSMGAAIALGAAESDASVRAIVLEAPYASLEASVSSALRRRRIPGFLAGPMLARAGRLAGVRLDQPPPIVRARRFDRPVLILTGSDDAIAPRVQVERLANAFPSLPRVLTIPGARHNDVFDLGGPQLAAEITAFLNDSLAPT